MSAHTYETDTQAIVRQRFLELVNLEGQAYDEARDLFIEDRLAQLEPINPPEAVSGLDGNYQGFLGRHTTFYPNLQGEGFRMDDQSMYAPALDFAKSFYNIFREKGASEEVAYNNATFWAAQYSQQQYFGNVHSGREGAGRREALVSGGDDLSDDYNGGPASVVDFKGIAQCFERAAVSNNVMQLLGSQPVFEIGHRTEGDRPSELHGFLLALNRRGQIVIFDPMNPHLNLGQEDGEEVLLNTEPAIYVVEGELSRGMVVEGVAKTKRMTAETPSVEKVPVNFALSVLGEVAVPH